MIKGHKRLDIIGSTEYVDVAHIKGIPAKIDTGADSSSIWASHIRVTKDGVLHFRLFDKSSPFYTGKSFKRKDFKAAIVRNAFGDEQIRYRTHLKLKLGDRVINVLFYLSNRSNNSFPILIGRRTISRKFFVDASDNKTKMPPRHPDSLRKTSIIERRLKQDPYRFHQKYIKKNSGDPAKIKLKKKGKLNEASHTV